jgi:hypothetical protein
MSRKDSFRFRPDSIIIGSITIIAVLLALQPIEFLVRYFLKDDAFYYFKTANNIVLGLGSTFDGINQTNGYHPLWMLNLILIYLVFPQSPLRALRLVLLTMAAYHILTVFMLYKTIQRLQGVSWGVASALVWGISPIVLRINLSGLESALYSLLLSGTIYFVSIHLKDRSGSWRLAIQDTPGAILPKAHLKIGVLIALCILARLDSVFLFVGLVMALGIVTHFDISRYKRILFAMVLPIMIFLGVYLVYNFITFHHIIPVSGVVKQPQVPIDVYGFLTKILWPLSPLYHKWGIGMLLLAFSLILVPFFVSVLHFGSFREILITTLRRYDWLWAGSILLYIYNALSATPYASWYYIPLIFCVLFSASEVIYLASTCMKISNNVRRFGFISITSFVVIFYAGLAALEFNPHKNEIEVEKLRAAQWLRNNLPLGSVGAAWNAGIMAYFSDRQVVNLDGLINSYEYAEAMKNCKEPEFILQQGVDYVFDMFPVSESGKSEDLLPQNKRHWLPYLAPHYKREFYAYNVGLSSLYNSWFPRVGKGATFVFMVWKLIPPAERTR